MRTLDRATGDVERARGDTGVFPCFDEVLPPPDFLQCWRTRSFIDSALLGDEESFGDPEPKDDVKDCEVVSMLRDIFPRRKKEGRFLTREECFRKIFPILLPSQGILFLESCFILVWSNGIVCIVRMEFSLSRLCLGSLESFAVADASFFEFLNIKLTTWTCCRPVTA